MDCEGTFPLFFPLSTFFQGRANNNNDTPIVSKNRKLKIQERVSTNGEWGTEQECNAFFTYRRITESDSKARGWEVILPYWDVLGVRGL